MPVLIAPIAGALSDRIGGRVRCWSRGWRLQAIGLGWLAAVAQPHRALPHAWSRRFVVAGVGMSLFFAPVANVVLSSVRRDQEGIASGANNAIRELGGVFGIAVLGAVFSAHGGYASGTAFVSGLAPAVVGRCRGRGRRRGRRAAPAPAPSDGRGQPRRRAGRGTRSGSLTQPGQEPGSRQPRDPGSRVPPGLAVASWSPSWPAWPAVKWTRQVS